MSCSISVNYQLLLVLLLCFKIRAEYNDFGTPRCTLQNGAKGVCVPLKKCPSGLQRYRNDRRGTSCWVRGYTPYICCDPEEDESYNRGGQIVGDKSRQKCREWYPQRRRLWYGSAALVGGLRSLSREFPHMAALGYVDGNETRWACGGSLISNKFILTAAHCIKNKELGTVIKIRLGELNLKSNTDDADPQDFTIRKTFRHPNFKSPSQYNDIALIELDKEVRFNDYIKPACLQTENDFGYGELIATGWGNLEYTGPPAEHLQKVYLDSFDNEICNTFYEEGNKRRLANGIVDRMQLCAGGIEKDTCQGDSGGPLQIKNQDAIDGYTIVGITSFGKACGLTDSPGVYTRVSNYIKWIESIAFSKTA